MKQIENLFWERGYRNHNGKKIAHTTMSGMIANPEHKGYYVGNKVRIVDMFTKKQKFLPPEEWVMFKDESGEIMHAIVSEELWDAANAVLTRRSKDVKRRQNLCNHDNLLTGKLFCTHCGAAYYRRDAKDRKGSVNSKPVCSGKIKKPQGTPALPCRCIAAGAQAGSDGTYSRRPMSTPMKHDRTPYFHVPFAPVRTTPVLRRRSTCSAPGATLPKRKRASYSSIMSPDRSRTRIFSK